MKSFKLFTNELKHIYKQSLLLIAIAMFLFTLSISVWCFSRDMIDGYKEYLDSSLDVVHLSVYDLDGVDRYTQIDALGDYFFANARGITYYPTLRCGDKSVEETLGDALIFRDNLPYYFKDCEFSGRTWTASDNLKSDNNYPIFLSQSVADELSVTVGADVILECRLATGWTSCTMTVEGIYTENEEFIDDFILPFNFILERQEELLEGISVYIEIQNPSDVMDIYTKLTRMGLKSYSMYVSVEEITLVNSMRYILIGVSVLVLVLTFVVLNNILTITVNSRKKYMAKLKLLGATTNRVATVYYLILVLSFIIAFCLGIVLSYFFCGYFSEVAKQALNYSVTITLQWIPCLTLFCLSCLLILLRYFLFKRKIKNITPGAFVKEE